MHRVGSHIPQCIRYSSYGDSKSLGALCCTIDVCRDALNTCSSGISAKCVPEVWWGHYFLKYCQLVTFVPVRQARCS